MIPTKRIAQINTRVTKDNLLKVNIVRKNGQTDCYSNYITTTGSLEDNITNVLVSNHIMVDAFKASQWDASLYELCEDYGVELNVSNELPYE